MKAKFGFMACEGCNADGKKTRILVRINEKETLSATCEECDATEYAQKGTAKHARWLRKLERIAAPAAPGKEEKPAPAKAAADPKGAPAKAPRESFAPFLNK